MLNRLAGHVKEGKRDRQPKAPRTHASRVDIEHAPILLCRCSVRVPADYNAHSCNDGIEVQVGKAMDEVEETSAELDRFCEGEFCQRWVRVYIAANSSHWRKLSETVQHCEISDVPGVQDVVYSRERRHNLGPK